MIIRPARTNEAGLLSQLAMRSKAVWGYDKTFMDACKEELTYSACQLTSDKYLFFIAVTDDTVLGFYSLKYLTQDTCELEALFVEPDHIGKGIGRFLMSHALDQCKKCSISRLTIQSDPHTEHFYRAAGATAIGQRESGSVPGRFLPLFEFRFDPCMN